MAPIPEQNSVQGEFGEEKNSLTMKPVTSAMQALKTQQTSFSAAPMHDSFGMQSALQLTKIGLSRG
jgi:hypothetical protein